MLLPVAGRLVSIFALVLLLMGSFSPLEVTAQGHSSSDIAIVIHGGAGTILPENMTEAQEAAYRAALREALETGYKILQDGGTSLDAVEATLRTMEDSPLFNAGRGAVFTSENTVEMDASIMEGKNRQAGAVTGVKHIRHPISLARAVMEQSPHVMLAGEGAEFFAWEQGFEFTPNSYFYTQRRLRQALEAREASDASGKRGAAPSPFDHKYGTVGAVALDQDGNLAAATSTGGLTNKRYGRIGDSPIIGAGTYADNAACAVSATGSGEYFIRAAAAHSIAARMKYGGQSLQEAAEAVVLETIPALGGSGGVIALDRAGNIAMPFTTPGMYRGYIDTDGNRVVRIYRDEGDQ